MQRWLAVLLLASTVGAQFSAIACPLAHHSGQPEPVVPAHHSSHSHETAFASASGLFEKPIQPHHGDATNCDMMASCSGLVTVFFTLQFMSLNSDPRVQLTPRDNTHAAVFLATPTPPPKLG